MSPYSGPSPDRVPEDGLQDADGPPLSVPIWYGYERRSPSAAWTTLA